MQESQHTQQTATRTAKNQDKKKQHECKWLQKHRRHTETNKHLLREMWEYRLGTFRDKCTHFKYLTYKLSALFTVFIKTATHRRQ